MYDIIIGRNEEDRKKFILYIHELDDLNDNNLNMEGISLTEFDDFSVGDMVQHNLFGVGTIIVLNGSGENQKVGIEFKDGLKKKLIVKYANLKRID